MLHTRHIFLLNRSWNINKVLMFPVSPEHVYTGVTLTRAARFTEPHEAVLLGQNAMQIKAPFSFIVSLQF